MGDKAFSLKNLAGMLISCPGLQIIILKVKDEIRY
jgi:hypothetical protein